ncbi:hypothetical protein MKX03_017397 [Papaver bracteatum]|nr:hypothetical protein MKX03_017397 [Papaver bracteatum]
MAERAHRLTDAKIGKPSQFYQPLWMSHCVQQRNNLKPQVHNCVVGNDESRLTDWDSNQASTLSLDKGACDIPEYKNTWRYGRDIDVASDVPQSLNEYGAASKTRRLAHVKMFVNTGNLNSARSELRPFPVSNFNQKMTNVLALKKEQSVRESYTSRFQTSDYSNLGCDHLFPSTMLEVPNLPGLPAKVCRSPQEPLEGCEHSVITQPILRPSQEDLPSPNFRLMQHGFEVGETSGQSFARRKQEPNTSSSYIQPREHIGNAKLSHPEQVCNYRGGSMALLFDNSNDKQHVSQNSGTIYSRQNNDSHKPHDHSTRDFPSPSFGRKQVRQNTGFSNIGFLPESSKSFHHLLVAKTDVHLYKKDLMVMESSAVSTEYQGNTLTELKKKDAGDRKSGSLSIKNESSAETETMDIETHQKRNYSMGMASPPANKEFTVGSNPAQFSPSKAKAGRKMIKMKLLDLNQKPASFLTSARSMENMDSITSRTESFDADFIPFHVAKHDNWHTNLKEDSIYVGLDPSSQQAKRLKLTPSDLIRHGTTTFRNADAPSITKVGKQLKLKQSSNYSETVKEQSMSGKSFAKEDMEMGKTVMSGNGIPTSKNLAKGRWDVMLSNPWIRRWRHNVTAASLTKSTEPVNGKPQCSKKSLDEFQTKQLPSIEAMALLGKAMTGVQECEFTDRGSFVVWSTGGLLQEWSKVSVKKHQC